MSMKERFLAIADAEIKHNPAHPAAGYILDQENEPVMNKLGTYYCNGKGFETGIYSLNKGICLIGNVESGKTFMMTIFGRMFKIPLITCRHVAHTFAVKGPEATAKWGYLSRKEIIFDDLGAEPLAAYYGNKVDIMAEMIQDRYEIFIQYGIRTHFTTNLSLEQMKDRYTDRVESRMHQLCNFVGLGTDLNSKKRRRI